MESKSLLWVSIKKPASSLENVMRAEGYLLCHAKGYDDAVFACKAHQPELVFVDSDIPQVTAPRLINAILERIQSAHVICVVDADQSDLASECLLKGASDYLMKPFLAEQLEKSIRNAKVMSQGTASIVAASQEGKRVLQMANRVAMTDATVLIQGESGTGKERLAQFIHSSSGRANKPFVAINCAAIPENMLEAMLFGYNKGAFTGAVNSQAGKFEAANGGTVFLDEISELPLPLQGKLLRVLQERQVERLGSNTSIDLNIRIIAATNRDIKTQIEQGLFRDDLYYRLAVLPLTTPALRDRRADILPLAQFFIKKYGSPQYSLSYSAKCILEQYTWPGNVRELENVMQRAIVLARSAEIQVSDLDLPVELAECCDIVGAFGADQVKQTKQKAEYEYIQELLQRFKGHRTHTAKALGVSTRALRYKLAAMREQGFDVAIRA